MKNRKQSFFQLVAIALLILSLLIIGLPTLAQDGEYLVVTGEVTFDTETGELMVNGYNIAPADAFIPADLTEGDTVIITGELLADGITIQADTIELFEAAEDEVADTDTDTNTEVGDTSADTDNAEDSEDADNGNGNGGNGNGHGNGGNGTGGGNGNGNGGNNDAQNSHGNGNGNGGNGNGQGNGQGNGNGGNNDAQNSHGNGNGNGGNGNGQGNGQGNGNGAADSQGNGQGNGRGNGNANGNGNGRGVGRSGNEQGEGRGDLCAGGSRHHPVATRIAEDFDMTESLVLGIFCQGFGFGEITLALTIAENANVNYVDILAEHRAGTGWGEIMANYGLNSSQLAIGRGNGRGNGNANGNGNGRGGD